MRYEIHIFTKVKTDICVPYQRCCAQGMSESGRSHLDKWQCFRSCSQQQGSQRVCQETYQSIYANGRYSIRPLIYGTYDIQQQVWFVFFNDKEVHSVLERSGIKKKIFDTENKANEWFITDLETVKRAIIAVKEGTWIIIFCWGFTRQKSHCIPTGTAWSYWKD